MPLRTTAQTFAVMFAALALPWALVACGDDSSGSGGSTAGSGGEGGSGLDDAAATTTSTTSAQTSTSSSSDGGGTGEGGAAEGGAAGQGGTGGTGDGGAGGAGGSAELAFLPIWENVAFPADGGRVELEAFTGVTLQMRVAGTEEVALDLGPQTLPAGFIVHAYAVGLLSDTSLDTYIVQDNDELTGPDAGEGNIRLAHFSPDVPAVDVYLTDEAFNMYGPLLDTDTFDFPSMSRYGSFPAGTYEATVVPTGGSPFGEAYGIYPGIEIVMGASETLALVGLDGAATLDLAVYTDDLTTPEGGSAAVTFVHAAPDAVNLDVGALVPVE